KRNSLARELADHLARRAAELHASGLSLAQARRQAAAEFGSLDAIAEEVRDARPLRWLRDAFQDLRFALRSWRRAPAFACSALAILALGLAANAIVFGVVQATLLRPLSFPHSTQLVYLSEYDNHGADQTFSDPDLADYQAQMSPVFSAMGGYRD